MKIFSAIGATILILSCGCTHIKTANPAIEARLQTIKEKYAPDDHLAIFKVTAFSEKQNLVARGEVDNPAAKKEVLEMLSVFHRPIVDKISVLPSADLGNQVWGISTLSVANMRENPFPGAELGTQVLMGNTIRLWKKEGGWFLAQTADKYLGWIENDSFVHCTKEEAEAWNASTNKLIVTELEDRILQKVGAKTFPVCDVVAGDLLKKIGSEGDWLKVELPDKRTGFLKKTSAQNFAEWKKNVVASPEHVEEIARSLLGTPYLWGANSSKALDCSGFTRTVFLLNGIALNRNASHQAKQGRDISLADDFAHLQKGDLLFFGTKGNSDKPEKITHVGIYLGDKKFIHASGMVRINSLDPESPMLDAHRLKNLVRARRFLPDDSFIPK